jgi:N6-adenosine-specific RNA methylase IME4
MKVDIFNTDKKYNIIYADPPWEYKQSGSKKNSRGMAKQHYETMKTEDICNLPIKNIKTDDCICFMWATFPNIDQALKVMKAWGFEYKTAGFVWIKKNKKSNTNFWGMGAYTRANAEVCLLGISKNTKAKQIVKSNNVHQIIENPIEEHSKKPNVTRDKIIQLLGDVPRIELFARQICKGWDCWGNEV